MSEPLTTSMTVETWRDHRARELPGAALGSVALVMPASRAASELYRSGARCVRMAAPVRLCADATAADVRALVLIRELTALGAAVSWTASCDDDCVSDRRFFHLFPPAAVDGARPPAVREWRERYLPGMCLCRRGPGFLEVRDRRWGTLEILTLDEPDALVLADQAADGMPASEIPDTVRGPLREAALLSEQGGLAWWLPTRVHRWPTPSMIV